MLFVGNSLTYVNDLPAIVAALAAADRQEALAPETVAFPDYSLEDHWLSGAAVDAIRRGGWEVVILQQGPSSLPGNQANLKTWTERFAVEVRNAGARPALYMVWPDASRQHAFDAVSQACRAAAEAVDGVLYPVGEAWRAAWRRDPDAPLYGADGFHPSHAGSYLAALVIYQQLYDRSPAGLPASLRLAGGSTVAVSPQLAAVLQAAAAEANAALARPVPSQR